MLSATDFLPLIITWFMNFASVTLPNLGSGNTSRLATTRLLGILLPFYLFRLIRTPTCHEGGGGRGSALLTVVAGNACEPPLTWDAWLRTWNDRCDGRPR